MLGREEGGRVLNGTLCCVHITYNSPVAGNSVTGMCSLKLTRQLGIGAVQGCSYSVALLPIYRLNNFFFLEHAGEMCIFCIKNKKGWAPVQYTQIQNRIQSRLYRL
jgi:hypothetical protein